MQWQPEKAHAPSHPDDWLVMSFTPWRFRRRRPRNEPRQCVLCVRGVLRQSLRLGVCLRVWCMVLMIFYCSDSRPGTKQPGEDVISGVSLEKCPEPGWNNDDGFFVWERCYHSADLLSPCLCLLWYLLSGWQLGASVSWRHTKYPGGPTDTDELNGTSPLVKKTETKRNNSYETVGTLPRCTTAKRVRKCKKGRRMINARLSSSSLTAAFPSSAARL